MIVMTKSGMLLTLRMKRRKPDLLVRSDNPTPPSIEKTPKLELKPLPNHLRYAFLGENNTLPIIISNKLSVEQEMRVSYF